MKITPHELATWLENPTTCKVLEYINKQREELKDNLADNIYTADGAVLSMGMCKGFKEILKLSYDDFVSAYDLKEINKEEENDDSNTKLTDATS